MNQEEVTMVALVEKVERLEQENAALKLNLERQTAIEAEMIRKDEALREWIGEWAESFEMVCPCKHGWWRGQALGCLYSFKNTDCPCLDEEAPVDKRLTCKWSGHKIITVMRDTARKP